MRAGIIVTLGVLLASLGFAQDKPIEMRVYQVEYELKVPCERIEFEDSTIPFSPSRWTVEGCHLDRIESLLSEQFPNMVQFVPADDETKDLLKKTKDIDDASKAGRFVEVDEISSEEFEISLRYKVIYIE